MRTLKIFAFLTTISCSCFCQNLPPYQYPTLKNKLIKAHEISNEYVYFCKLNKKGKIIDSALVFQGQYDTLGNIFVEIVSLGYMQKKKFYSYNNLSQLKKAVTLSKINNRLLNTLEYDYDSLGNDIAVYSYNADTSMVLFEQKVFVDRYLQFIKLQRNAEFPFVSAVYEYYPDGRTKKIESFDKFTNQGSVTLFEYDTVRNKVFQYSMQQNKKRLEVEYSYTTNDRLLQRINYNYEYGKGEVVTLSENYYYNEIGLNSSIWYYINYELSFKMNFHYY